MARDTITVRIEANETSDDLEVPERLVDMLREAEEGTAPEIMGDELMLSFAQRMHSAIHHAEGEPTEEIEQLEQLTMDLFEERFGESFGEVTGHQH